MLNLKCSDFTYPNLTAQQLTDLIEKDNEITLTNLGGVLWHNQAIIYNLLYKIKEEISLLKQEIKEYE